MKSGKYAPRVHREVHHWPSPDVNGDGAPVKVRDESGRTVEKKVDGKTVRRYRPPAGFKNLRSDDGTENYVRVDEFGEPVRDVHGNAIRIDEGGLSVLHPDGSHEVIRPEDVEYWESGHEHVGDLEDESSDDDEGPEGSE